MAEDEKKQAWLSRRHNSPSWTPQRWREPSSCDKPIHHAHLQAENMENFDDRRREEGEKASTCGGSDIWGKTMPKETLATGWKTCKDGRKTARRGPDVIIEGKRITADSVKDVFWDTHMFVPISPASELNVFHPSIHFLHPLNPSVGSRGGLKPIQAVIGREAGYTLDRSLVHHRATQRQKRQTTTHTLTLTPNDNFRETKLLFCSWKT